MLMDIFTYDYQVIHLEKLTDCPIGNGIDLLC